MHARVLINMFGFFIPRTWLTGAVMALIVGFWAMMIPAGPDGLIASGLGTALLAGVIMDELTEFCDATALNTGAAGTYLIGDVIDLGSAARDIGNGKQLYLVISVDTTATSGGAATGQFVLASDAQAAIATDGTATEHVATAAIAVATLVAGYQLVLPVPPQKPVYERYLGILQKTGTAAFTAGKVNAFLTTDPPVIKSYPNAANS